MNSSPALQSDPSDGNVPPPRTGGNLALPQANSRQGHSLFSQMPDNGAADISDPNKVAATSPATKAGARLSIGALPLPLREVNDVVHSASMRVARRRSALLQIIFRLRCWWLLQEIGWKLAWREVVRWRR